MGAILVFDITNHTTYENLDRWKQELLRYVRPNIEIMLVGNKSDEKHLRTVSTEEACQFAENHQFSYMETSAKDSNNVAEAFSTLISNIYWKQSHQSDNQDTENDKSSPDVSPLVKLNSKQSGSKKKTLFSCCNTS